MEPIYGVSYLPHKFKVAIGLPTDNSVDVLSQDVGLMAIVDRDRRPELYATWRKNLR